MEDRGIEVESGYGRREGGDAGYYGDDCDLTCLEVLDVEEEVVTTEINPDGHRCWKDLICREEVHPEVPSRRATTDSNLMGDDRVLKNLLAIEVDVLLASDPYKFHKNITLEMREILAKWMYEVSVEKSCQQGVFSLSVSFVDRFIRACPKLRSGQFQLLGTVCLFIASKMKDESTNVLSSKMLAALTDDSVTSSEIIEWELTVLHSLQWDTSTVTPQDFLEVLLSRLSKLFSTDIHQRIGGHASILIDLCMISKNFVICPPSLIASACIMAAAAGLTKDTKYRTTSARLPKILKNLINCDIDHLKSCHEQIEEIFERACHISNSNIDLQSPTPTIVSDIIVLDELKAPICS